MIDSQAADRILEQIGASTNEGFELRKEAMTELSHLPGYDWCGIYRLEGEFLILDAYVGADTDHTQIPVGVGVCGTAVATNSNQVIEDVRTLENYLACSVSTRSEIVTLIRDETGEILGQIDIDSHRINAFDQSDETFLDKLGVMIARRWK